MAAIKRHGGALWRAYQRKEDLRKHRDGILDAIRLGLTNARLEELNQRVRSFMRRAFGFHSAKAALALVMLSAGPIDLTLPWEHQA